MINPYGIDYANIIVYLPRNLSYEALMWTTSPQKNVSTNVTPSPNWSIHMNNLEAAGIHFHQVEVLTDSGYINVDVSRCPFPLAREPD